MTDRWKPLRTRFMRFKKATAKRLRLWSTRLDDVHLVVVSHDANGATMAGYLSALARKKGFNSWTEYRRTTNAKRAGRYIQAGKPMTPDDRGQHRSTR